MPSIDNAGGGDCGFLAMAIGLIDIIQKEHKAKKQSPTFKRLQVQAGRTDQQSKIYQHQILDANLGNIQRNPNAYNELLQRLQMSLREIPVKRRKEDLQIRIETEDVVQGANTIVEGSSIFNKFLELVRNPEISSQFNELALSPEVVELAIKTKETVGRAVDVAKEDDFRLIPLDEGVSDIAIAAKNKIENTIVKNMLKRDVAKKGGSVILKGIEKITKKGHWATHSDLNEIAAALEINLSVLGQPGGAILKDRPTVSLNNLENTHWTTNVEVIPQPEPVRVKASSSNSYAKLSTSLREEPVGTELSKSKTEGFKDELDTLRDMYNKGELEPSGKNSSKEEAAKKAEVAHDRGDKEGQIEADKDLAKILQQEEFGGPPKPG